MAEDRMALVELAEKVADGDLLRELGQLVLQRLMEAEVDARRRLA
jgi:putative transposase